MKLDLEATGKAPAGWEIWTNKGRWQAMKKGAQPGDIGAWGPMQRSVEDALADAAKLSLPQVESK